MGLAIWPSGVPSCPFNDGVAFAPQDVLARFQPDVGVPITRPRLTAGIDTMSIELKPMTRAQFAAWREWAALQLKNGALPFLWRDPLSTALSRWMFTAPYSSEARGNRLQVVTIRVMRLPGSLWYAPYVPSHLIAQPGFVADWSGSVFGIGETMVAASGLSAVAGDYTVYIQRTNGTSAVQDLTFTEDDLGATAPSGVARYVGFAR